MTEEDTKEGPAGRIARLFIDSNLTPLFVVVSLVLGAFAIRLTPREEEPQVVVPMVDVFVRLPGSSPQEVENRVTIPLERRMWQIPGVEYVYSTSMQGLTLVTVRFLVGEDMERSLVKVYDKLAGGMDLAPVGASPPLVKLRTIDDVSVLNLTLWSQVHDGFALRRIAAELSREIASATDVSEVRIIGGQRREVRVRLDGERLAAFDLDPLLVAQAIESQNVTLPAGHYESGGREVAVETGSFLLEPTDIAALVVGVREQKPVYLRQVAEVLDGPEEVVDYVLFAPGPAAARRAIEVPAPGDVLLPAVTISVAKRKGADAHRVAEAVKARAEALRGRLIPQDVQMTVTRDYGETSSEKARDLLTHLLGAVVSVTFVIALLLGWRGGFVVFVSVPVTFALTLFVYYMFDYTLNRVTLFALIFVTGIVVDDSIIVVENMVRHFSMRELPPMRAAIRAVNEVGNPTILATLAVIAAVLPMAFVRGLMGPYMSPMPVGATLAMVFSLLVALVIAPWFAIRLLRKEPPSGEAEYRIEETRTYRVYRRILLPMMLRPWRGMSFLLIVLLLLVGSVALFPLRLVTVKMLPFDNKSEVQVILDMPEGTTLERTAGVAREIVEYLRGVNEVTDLEVYVGTAAPVNFNGLVRHYDLRRGSHVADVQVNLVHKNERSEQSHAIAERIRPAIHAIVSREGGNVKIAEIPPGPPVLSTLVAEIYGPDSESRLETARQVREIFEDTPGVVDVDWYVEAAQSKKIFRVDRERAALQGVTPVRVARTLGMALGGEAVGVLHDPREVEGVNIVLQVPREERSSVDDLRHLRIASGSGRPVSMSELVSIEDASFATSLYRKNLRPVVYVTGDVAGVAESPVYAILEMDRAIERIEPRVDVFYRDQPASTERPAMKWDGEWHITYEVFRDLGAAFGVVLVLIYVLIIGWFRSFLVPLVMMIAIPLSLVGILPAHWLFGAFFTATSMIGFIALAGIMVRNSLLLIDFVDLSLARGRTLGEAVLEAGAVRFRPILLTAGTVVVGALVMLFDPIFQGLAISLMAGATASTVLTLVVVPLVHFLVERRRHADALPPHWVTADTALEKGRQRD